MSVTKVRSRPPRAAAAKRPAVEPPAVEHPAAERPAPAQPADGATLTDRAYVMLEELITTLQLPPGAFLSEMALAQRLGFGRTPIREDSFIFRYSHSFVPFPVHVGTLFR